MSKADNGLPITASSASSPATSREGSALAMEVIAEGGSGAGMVNPTPPDQPHWGG
jgi:hypothetical protein